MIICVDFDGTIHDGVWPAIGEPREGAKEVINNLRAEGHYIIIWTCREGVQQTEMVNWLLAQGIGFDRVNDHNPAQVSLYIRIIRVRCTRIVMSMIRTWAGCRAGARLRCS